jgi:hypothetical protein
MQAIKNKKKGLNPYLDGLGGIYIPWTLLISGK